MLILRRNPSGKIVKCVNVSREMVMYRIQQHQELVVRGVYAYVRHPMYLSFLLSAIGTFLLSANWFIGVPLIVWFWVMYLGRVKRKGHMMLEGFGEQYKAYMRSSGCLLPKWRTSHR